MKLWKKRFQDFKNHTIFKLVLTAGTKKFSKVILKLDFPPSFYRIEITPNAFYLVHRNFLTIFNWKAAVCITERLTSTPHQFVGEFYLLPWEVGRVEAILASNYYTATILVLDHRFHILDRLLFRVGLSSAYGDPPPISGTMPMQIMPMTQLQSMSAAGRMGSQQLYPLPSLKETMEQQP